MEIWNTRNQKVTDVFTNQPNIFTADNTFLGDDTFTDILIQQPDKFILHLSSKYVKEFTDEFVKIIQDFARKYVLKNLINILYRIV